MLTQLRAETQAQHERLERELDLLRPDLTLPEYVSLLEQMLLLYAPLERTLAAAIPAGWAARLELEQRVKSGWLRADLDTLRPGRAVPAAAPLRSLPDLHGEAAAWGALYVLEGATLGGQIICRSLGGRLGLTPGSGLRFYASYGGQVGPRWKAFCAAIEDRAGQEQGERATAFVDAAVRGAQATFAAFAASAVPARRGAVTACRRLAACPGPSRWT